MVKLRFFSFVLSIVFLDQLTKYLITLWLPQPLILIPGFLYLTRVQNYGAGFGIMQGQRWLLIWITVIVVGIVLYYYDRARKNRRLLLGSALILGGALGNLIDRVFLGYVVDFIALSFWPAFNVADSAVTIGAFVLIFTWTKKK